MKNDDVVITSAFRTAIGSFNGSLSSKTAPELGSTVIKKCVENSELKKEEIDMVYMGQVLTTGTGQNPARQASILAGLANETTNTTVNQVCGSGLASVALAYNSIKSGDGEVIIAGGQESMTNSPHYMNIRKGIKMGDGEAADRHSGRLDYRSSDGIRIGLLVQNNGGSQSRVHDGPDQQHC